MTQLSAQQIAQLVHAHTNDAALAAQAVAVALAESGGRTDARHENRNSAGVVTSTDRGLWQINDRWHPEVSGAVADDPVRSTAAAATIAGGGFRNMTPWSTYKSGSYKRQMPAAVTAVQAVYGTQSGAPGPVGDVAASIGDVITAPFDGLAAVGRFAASLGERSTWIRVVEVVGGAALITLGASMLKVELAADVAGKVLGSDKADAAAAVIPGGKVAKAALVTAAKAKGSK